MLPAKWAGSKVGMWKYVHHVGDEPELYDLDALSDHLRFNHTPTPQ